MAQLLERASCHDSARQGSPLGVRGGRAPQRVFAGTDVFEVPNASGLDWFLLAGIDHVEKLNNFKSKNRKFNVAAKSVVRPKRPAADPLASRDPWRD